MARILNYTNVENGMQPHSLDQYRLGTVWPVIGASGAPQVHLDLFATQTGKKAIRVQEAALGDDYEHQMDILQTIRMSPEAAKALAVALIDAASQVLRD